MTQKLLLFEIFSYSCMNCLRSLDFIKKIDNKYKKYGLKTILIHAPEWEFEKDHNNILRALKKYKIKFPIIIDKNKNIIKNLKINFWPTRILIQNDMTIYKHIGEGGYKKLEEKITSTSRVKTRKIFKKEPRYAKFPTVYAGKRKGGRISEIKKKLKFGIVYIEGNWKQNDEFSKGDGFLTIRTKGKIISLVAKSVSNKPINLKIKLNNKFVKNLRIDVPQSYDILKLKDNVSKVLSLETKSELEVYSFSFR